MAIHSSTPHTPPAAPLAIVGDAIISGSTGGGKVSCADALSTNHEHVLTLAPATILARGHGTLTNLGEEKRLDPFFTT